MTVFVSAGHNPIQVGAVYTVPNTNKIITEYSLTKLYADAIESALVAVGIKVNKVPTGSLTSKINHINKYAVKGDIAIEVHFNSDPGLKGVGCETLYCPGSVNGKATATRIQANIIKAIRTDITDRGIKEGWYRMDVPGRVDFPGDKNGDEVPDAFLANTKCVGIIVEPFFMKEFEKAKLYQTIVARAIAQACLPK